MIDQPSQKKCICLKYQKLALETERIYIRTVGNEKHRGTGIMKSQTKPMETMDVSISIQVWNAREILLQNNDMKKVRNW